MRILVATTAGAGHFAPLVPFATACRDAGHAVRVAAPASFTAAVRNAGFEHTPLADAPAGEIGPVFERLPTLSTEEANTVIVRDVFAGIDARAALPAMQAAVDDWRPDVILRETAEFASYLVAESNGIPHAQVAMSLTSMEDFAFPLVDAPLRELGSRAGAAGLSAAVRLSLVPESLEDGAQPAQRRTYRFRYSPMGHSDATLPKQWWSDSSAPLVYMTFGSVAANIGFFPDFYRAMLDAVAELPARILLTVGNAGDPEQLGPLQPNVHAERWLPQEQVMPHTAAMLVHGGFGTMMTGLAAGVPMVVVPLFAMDQYANARRVEAVGAGRALSEGLAAIPRVREALEQVLDDGAYRAAARALADEMAGLPDPSECIGLLATL
jgi:UDP:flavonoid glycosyltransferase YjiC (YdhE family)